MVQNELQHFQNILRQGSVEQAMKIVLPSEEKYSESFTMKKTRRKTSHSRNEIKTNP